MTRRLHTEASVRELPRGSELVLAPGEIATPSALELAFARGIRVRWSDGAATPAAGQAGSALWGQLLAQDGTYVVEVKNGRARVHRLAASGPVFVGEVS
jgi:hypothetical protein